MCFLDVKGVYVYCREALYIKVSVLGLCRLCKLAWLVLERLCWMAEVIRGAYTNTRTMIPTWRHHHRLNFNLK